MKQREVADALNISLARVAYYCESMDHYRTRKNKERKAFLLKLKEKHGMKCAKCGYDKNKSVLSFHHTDPSNKEHEVSDLVRNSRFALAEKEAAKCILLCCNCHMELHNPEG